MILYRKIAGSIVLVFIGLFEIAERAAFVKEHLPRWITMHSDVTVISLLMVLCFYLMFGNRENNQSTKMPPMPKITNAPAGGSATATAEGGKIVQHLHFPNPLSIPPENGTKHKHNVRYIGFRQAGYSPKTALLCFQNVLIPGEAVGEFRSARLKITYYDTNDKEIAEIFPALWWGDSQAVAVDIGATTSCAVAASFLAGKWTACQVIDAPLNFGTENRLELVDLPIGQVNISATLIGEHNLSIKPIEGMLFLEKDGSALFVEW